MFGNSSIPLPLNKLLSSILLITVLLFTYLFCNLLKRYLSSLFIGFYFYLSTLSNYLSAILLDFFLLDD